MTSPLTAIPLILLIVLAAFVMVWAFSPAFAQAIEDVQFNVHATNRHGIEALYARTCNDNPNSTLFFNPTTNRYAAVCLTDRGWGLFIFESVDGVRQEITAFIRNKARTFTDVVKYLERAGYTLIQ